MIDPCVVSEWTVEHAGVELAVAEAGEGTPVVLLHGLTASRHYVVMGSRSLERGGHRVLACDARGHGRSGAAPDRTAYDYGDLGGDLLAVLDAAAIERSVLVGASMGAHTILRVALHAPERVAGLVVVTPAVIPGVTREDLARWDALADGLEQGGIEGFVAAYDLARVPERWRETMGKVLRQRLAQHADLRAVADAVRVVPRSAPFGSLDELGSIAAPAVVVASRDEADPGHPLAVGEAYAAAIPGAELRTEEPGHSPLAWQGGQLSQIIAGLAERSTARLRTGLGDRSA